MATDMKKTILSLVIAALLIAECHSQSAKLTRYFGQPIITDSTSTFFFPIRYNEEFLSANKIALGGDYYANIVVYDFLKDSSRSLFETDTYIKSLEEAYHFEGRLNQKAKHITKNWVFLLVKNKDSNDNGRIDERDPTILFASTITGNQFKSLTNETENVVSLEIFEKQGFALVRIQRDEDHDRSFKGEDRDFYYRKINLNDLSLGEGIEVGTR
jgi:hypothetical protein